MVTPHGRLGACICALPQCTTGGGAGVGGVGPSYVSPKIAWGIMWWAEGTGLPRWTGTLVLPALLARFRMNDREGYCLRLVCTYVCAPQYESCNSHLY